MTQRSVLVRAIWFVFVGWWLTPIVVNIAWALNVTVILAPIGIKLINLVPTVLTLQEPRSRQGPGESYARLEASDGNTQHSLPVRALYFVFVGWWLSFLWANLAALLAMTIIGLPVAIWLANRLPYVTSLYRFHG
ncbi:Inner membrane component domain-containing protein [Halobiforma haloterrestris]|uniref:Inner membrane component domain-containing protein n=1 Tax=Natronobacterium haloterrestre TaxID=148448 RepID=A0A1I1H6D4_NATHA|nr:YccF domain-containing protein [Halobiforma haloterrestris]SFC19132.1 Inner membrane component domain-containing protein [Halobiforma haloterrestris]